METKKFVCIECPVGCNLTANKDGDNVTVEGNKCPRGAAYAKSEVTNPQRTVTSTVRLTCGKMCAVKTNIPIAKEAVKEVMEIINTVHPSAPVRVGDVLYKNIFLNADLVSADDVK